MIAYFVFKTWNKKYSPLVYLGEELNSINILVKGDTERRMIVEFEGCEDYTERVFPIEKISGKCTVSLTFLPGSNFDIKSFGFIK